MAAETTQTYVVILLAIIAVAFVYVSVRVASLFGRLTRLLDEKPEDRIAHLKAMTRANQQLVNTRAGLTRLVTYSLSEAAVMSTLQEVAGIVDTIEIAPDSDEEVVVRQIVESLENAQKRNGWDKFKAFFKNHGKEIGGKLFDKINSLVKGLVIPGGGGD